MDGPRLPGSGCAYLSPRQARLVQPGEFVGRRASLKMGTGSGKLITFQNEAARRRNWEAATERQAANNSSPIRPLAVSGIPPLGYPFGDGLGGGVAFSAAGDEGLDPCGAGVGGGLTSSSSTSKIRVAFGAISGPTDRSPYARFDGTKN